MAASAARSPAFKQSPVQQDEDGGADPPQPVAGPSSAGTPAIAFSPDLVAQATESLTQVNTIFNS